MLLASLNKKSEPPLFENLSSLGGVLIKFFGDAWKHGNPGEFLGLKFSISGMFWVG